MRWIKNGVVLVLCLSLLSSGGSYFAQTGPKAGEADLPTAENPTDHASAKDEPEAANSVSVGQSIKFGPVEPVTAYVNTRVIVLRESPEAGSPITAKVDVGDYEAVVILESNRGFARVRLETNQDAEADVPRRERAFEGWTTWDSLVPGITALVLDAETGAVISQVPLPEGLASVVFSPDGSRAMFFNGDGGIGNTAYEVQTSDYTFTRTLSSAEGEQFGSLFYGPADGNLYANAYLANPVLMRIGNDGLPNSMLELTPDIKISHDGRIGLIATKSSDEELTVDVIDMATLQTRNTFVVNGSSSLSSAGPFVLSEDGSEVYVRLEEEKGPISVIDTWTGQIVRELIPASGNGWTYFSPNSLIGGSLLVKVWPESEEENATSPQSYWLSSGQSIQAEAGIDFAVDAGGRRLAVNDEGTVLYKLDSNNRIQERININRPDRGTDAGDGRTVFGLSASPDGKHIIMFVGTEHGC